MAATPLRRRSALERPGADLARRSISGFKPVGESVLHHRTAACGVGAERREYAALPGLIAMARLQIAREQSGIGLVGRFRGGFLPVRGGLRRRLAAGLRDEIVLGREVAVEAAMREIGRLHDVGDADAAKAFGAKQRARRIDDAFAVLRRFLPAHSHDAPLLCKPTRLTSYMMIVINRQAIMMTVI